MMMTPEAWARTQELQGWDELGDAERAAMAIGCPRHGNASMDFDSDGVFCSRCDSEQAMRARDAVQDARTAALGELAEANGIERGDAVLASEDGGIRACERNLYGFCRTCGTDMRECVACGITGGELVRGLTGVLCADAATCEDRFLSAAGAL